MFPSELFFDPAATELAHLSSLLWFVEQPEDLVVKIIDLISRGAVQRCFLRAESTFFSAQLNTGPANSHVFHHLDHSRNVVPLTALILVYAYIRHRERLHP